MFPLYNKNNLVANTSRYMYLQSLKYIDVSDLVLLEPKSHNSQSPRGNCHGCSAKGCKRCNSGSQCPYGR